MNEGNSPEMKKSPDELVEMKILEQFKSSGCASDETVKAFKGKLSQGTLKAEDWIFAFSKQISASKGTSDEA